MPEPLLAIEGLTKRFGGVIASDGVTLSIPPGELHAIIGPNGAGKTTLIAQLTGELSSQSGRVRFAGEDITALPAWRRSVRGRPSSSNDSNRGGETVRPVTATRIGPKACFGFSPRPSTTASRSAASIALAVHSPTASRERPRLWAPVMPVGVL